MADPAALILPTSVGDLENDIDLWVDEQHQHALTLTEYPVESGATIASHAAVLPDNMTLRFIISNVHRGIPDVPRAYGALLDAMDAREAVQVVTRSRSYEQAVIVGVNSTAPGYGISGDVAIRELVVPGGEQGGIVPAAGSATARRTTSRRRGRVSPHVSAPGTLQRVAGA